MELDAGALREALKSWQFWSLQILTLFFALATARALPVLMKLSRQSAFPARWVGAAAIAAFAIAAFAAPRTNRIYFDEHIYQHIAQNMTDLGLVQMCNHGAVVSGVLQCTQGEYNKQPSGYPQVFSVLYRIFGVREALAFWLNAICAALTVVVVGLLATLLFADPRAGGFAALVMALVPEQLRWSNTAAAEPSAALACAMAVLAAVVFIRDRSTRALVWLVASAAFAAQFRPESILCVLLIGVIVWRLAPEELGRRRLWLATLAGLVLCSALVAHAIAVRDDPWGASGPRMSMDYLRANLSVNAPFYVADWRFPAIYWVLAAIGLVVARQTGARLIATLYFLLFWGVFLVFYAGSYDYGTDVRYSLLSLPPIALLAGAGLSAIAALVRAHTELAHRTVPILVATIATQFGVYMPYVRTVGEEAAAARADVEAARLFRGHIPPGGVVLTHTPSMFLLWGVNALQASIATASPETVEGLRAQHDGGVFLHWGFWCTVNDPVQSAFCSNALARFPARVVGEDDRSVRRYKLFKLF